jgi:hypothetical protein
MLNGRLTPVSNFDRRHHVEHPLADNREMNDRAPSADRQRILIVDDEPGIRRLMRDFLEGRRLRRERSRHLQ